MSTAAALAFTLLFVADDPVAPSVVVDVAEDDSGRRVDVAIVCGSAAGCVDSTKSLKENGPLEGSRRLRAWPVLPVGAALTPAVDGFIVTVDDVGAWQPPPPEPSPAPTFSKKTGSTSTSLPPLPTLPTIGARGLRLFVPEVGDLSGAAALPSSTEAALYGDRSVWRGHALVLGARAARKDGPGVNAYAVSAAVVDGVVEVDAGTALVVAEAAGACGMAPTAVAQGKTTSTVTSTACAGGVSASRLSGVRPLLPSKSKPKPKQPPAPTETTAWGVLVRPR